MIGLHRGAIPADVGRILAGVLVALGASAVAAPAKVLKYLPGYLVTYPKGKIGGSSAQGIPEPFVSIPPGGDYVLDYQVRFESDFEWVKGGKLPGLVGGSHTTGCNDAVQNGWSARFMWHERGEIDLYLYHQKRRSGCGDTYHSVPATPMAKSQWHRITQRVVLNAPGVDDGVVEVWLDGRMVLSQKNLQLRGKVGPDVARIDAISLQTFYGGSSGSWAPPRDTHATFGGFYLLDTLPDLSKPFGSDVLGTAIPPGVLRPASAENSGARRAIGGMLFGRPSAMPPGALGFDARGHLRFSPFP